LRHASLVNSLLKDRLAVYPLVKNFRVRSRRDGMVSPSAEAEGAIKATATKRQSAAAKVNFIFG